MLISDCLMDLAEKLEDCTGSSMLDFTVRKSLSSCGVLWTAVNSYYYILSGPFHPVLNTRGLRHSQFETTTGWTKIRGVSASPPGRNHCIIMALGETLEKEVLVTVKPSVSRWCYQENLERLWLSGNGVQRLCRFSGLREKKQFAEDCQLMEWGATDTRSFLRDTSSEREKMSMLELKVTTWSLKCKLGLICIDTIIETLSACRFQGAALLEWGEKTDCSRFGGGGAWVLHGGQEEKHWRQCPAFAHCPQFWLSWAEHDLRWLRTHALILCSSRSQWNIVKQYLLNTHVQTRTSHLFSWCCQVRRTGTFPLAACRA